MNKPTVLVSCCGPKAGGLCLAKDLYQSSLFKKCRVWAEKYGSSWYILSALHGLVDPNNIVGPYNLSIKAMNREAVLRWGDRVLAQIEARNLGKEFTCLAGEKYLAPLRGLVLTKPMIGLGIGKRLRWLDENT